MIDRNVESPKRFSEKIYYSMKFKSNKLYSKLFKGLVKELP